MEEAINTDRLKILHTINTISHQEIPVSPTSPLYSIFEIRKEIATRIIRGELNFEEKEMMMDLLESYNSNIKKYLGL